VSTTGAAKLEKRRELFSRLRNWLGLAILLGALGWSTIRVAIHSFGPDSDSALIEGKRVIRFAHWQLEGRCVEALNEACREYERLHPDVAVRQIEIPERAYVQWVRTQLIGRTAPDLIECRWWPDLTARYFVPLTAYAEQPNPYNADDPNLAGIPWRETYVDNMMGGWDVNLRDYYGIPLSLFTVRCYANKTLMEKAAGTSEAPKTLGEFIGVCDRIRAYARKHGLERELLPIAGSKYTENMFRSKYWSMGVWGLMDPHDTNCDGWMDEAERIEAILTGRLDLATDPHIRAAHRVLYDISRYFNPGFMGAQRDDSVFLFAQGNAVMIATGTWDAGSLWRQVADDFEIIAFDFPIAAPDEPYGQYIRHRVTEAGALAGFSMGLTRFSRHKDLAVDFMRFLTSRRQNEILNRKFRWFPAIRGAQPDEILEAFRPQEEGIYKALDPFFEGQTKLMYEQKYFAYISEVDPGRDDYEALLAAAKGDSEALVAKHGLLARRLLERVGDGPIDEQTYPFSRYIEDWREDHYDRFIRAYAADFDRLALDDFERYRTRTYHPIAQVEATVASARAKAVREGLTPQTRRVLSSVILGQANKIDGQARYRAVYRRLKEKRPQAQSDAGGEDAGR